MAGKRLVLEDMSTLEVKTVEDPEFLNATDLATSNLLYAPVSTKAQPVAPAANGERIGVYPNPVVNGRLTIVFHDMPAGRYAVDLMTTTGVAVQNKMVNVQQKGQTETMATNRMAKGLYIIRVTNASRQEAFAEKVLIQ
jgi:hypothetical protein